MNSRQLTKTKVLATIGPAIANVEMLENLIKAGLDGIRINFSHGKKEELIQIFNIINDVCVKTSQPIPILIDLQGPKIRIGELKRKEVILEKGETIEITEEDVMGDENIVSTSYKSLVSDSGIGSRILIDDGLLHLKVIEKKEKSIICLIEEGGVLKPRKGMNMPGMSISAPSVTKKDYENLEFALNYRVDFIALSFVRKAEDIKELRAWLSNRGKNIPIIAKIEKEEAVENFEKILSAADGIMVARGDLGVEMAAQSVPIIQKNIIKECNSVGKLVITATQMLESMVHNPVPTRAEASDVANAVLDGTDVVMLSAETSVGKFPVETIKIMKDIISRTELQHDLIKPIDFKIPLTLDENLFDAVGHGISNMSKQIDAKAIVVFTNFGKKAKLIAKFRPDANIYAFTNSFETMNNLKLHHGIIPFFYEHIDNEELAISEATKVLLEKEFIRKGDLIVYTAGSPNYKNGRRHWLQFAVV